MLKMSDVHLFELLRAGASRKVGSLLHHFPAFYLLFLSVRSPFFVSSVTALPFHFFLVVLLKKQKQVGEL